MSSAKVAVINGYVYGEIDDFIKSKKNNVVVISGSEDKMMERMVKLIDNRRVTTFIENSNVVDYFLQSNNIQNRYKTAGCLESIHLMIGFSPKDPRAQNFADRFDRELKILRESGELAQILGKYDIPDWK